MSTEQDRQAEIQRQIRLVESAAKYAHLDPTTKKALDKLKSSLP